MSTTKKRKRSKRRTTEGQFNTVNGSEVRFLKNAQENNSDLSAFANISHKNPSGANNWSKFTETYKQNKSHQASVNTFKESQLQTANIVLDGKTNFRAKLPSRNKTTVDKTKNYQDLQSRRYLNSKNHTESGIVGNMPDPVQDKNVNPKFTTSKLENSRPILTKHIAMDCEMVGVEIGVNKNMLARISLVNSHGDCIYDKFVKPTEPVLDYRTRVSGVRAKDLENATDFKIVQKEVSDMLKDRILVGHALKNDLKVLYLSHPKHSIRDTSRFKKFREGKTPALKKLANKYLGVVIQEGEHSSVQDALAAMQLYKMFKKEWESSIFSKKRQVKKYEKGKLCEPTQTVF